MIHDFHPENAVRGTERLSRSRADLNKRVLFLFVPFFSGARMKPVDVGAMRRVRSLA